MNMNTELRMFMVNRLFYKNSIGVRFALISGAITIICIPKDLHG